jgi:hypothetical protein
MKVEGSCHCGRVTFEADIDPGAVRICHCTDCQTFSSSAFRVSAVAPAANFALRTGSPRIYIKTTDSGKQRAQAFCADCGTLKQRAALKPTSQIWHRSALSWVADIGQIQSIERQ